MFNRASQSSRAILPTCSTMATMGGAVPRPAAWKSDVTFKAAEGRHDWDRNSAAGIVRRRDARCKIVKWWERELPMSEQDVAMRIAVASAFRDCGLPSDEQDVDDFLVALRSFGYVVERLVESRTDDE
jgi:hypothetical protein